MLQASFFVAVIGLAGKFVDFYAVLGVRADASQEEIWTAYNRKKEESAPLSSNAFGTSARERLLAAAIAILGTEERRMAYDFNGVGGTVDFDVHMEDLSPMEPVGSMAGGHQTVSSPGQAQQQSWGGYQEGSVIQGSGRFDASPSAPQAQPAPTDQIVQSAQPVPTPQSAHSGGGIDRSNQPVSAVPPSQFTQDGWSGHSFSSPQPASPGGDFTLRTTSHQNGGAYQGQDFAAPRPYRPYAEQDEEEENPFSQLLSKATLAVGAIFALLLSIAWMLELPLSGGGPVQSGAASLFKRFLVAANEKNIAILWAIVFFGGFVMWCVELFSIKLATWAIDTSFSTVSAGRKSSSKSKHKSLLLGVEILVFLVLFGSAATAAGNLNLTNDTKAMWRLIRTFFALFYLFLPLFILTMFVGRDALHSIVWQLFLLLGHMVFVLLLERILMGQMAPVDYFVGGLYKFGYASWWILFFLGYKGFERMSAR